MIAAETLVQTLRRVRFRLPNGSTRDVFPTVMPTFSAQARGVPMLVTMRFPLVEWVAACPIPVGATLDSAVEPHV